MNCNFYDNHKGFIKNLHWDTFGVILFSYIVFSFAVLFVISLFSFFYIGKTFPYMDKLIIPLVFAFPLFLIFVWYVNFKGKKKISRAEFTYKMFKDWYSLNPKRFVFDRDGFGFHYMVNGNPDYIDENYEIPSYSGRASDIYRTHKYLVPKTFLDYLKFTFFVEQLYFYKNSKKKKEENIMQKKMNNEELLAVLNVVQSDINKVLRDSQDILNKETEKLEKCVSEL